MRKRFFCGHRGKGKYCHRCRQEAETLQRSERSAVPAPTEATPQVLGFRPVRTSVGADRPPPAAPKVAVRRRQARREVDAYARSAARLKRQNLSKVDQVDLSSIAHLASLQDKARTIVRAILDGADYRLFQGKRLVISQREIISVPVGLRYRLIFCVSPLAVVDFMSHEDYNTFLTPSRVKSARRGKANDHGERSTSATAKLTN
jgi:hypothetical protein